MTSCSTNPRYSHVVYIHIHIYDRSNQHVNTTCIYTYTYSYIAPPIRRPKHKPRQNTSNCKSMLNHCKHCTTKTENRTLTVFTWTLQLGSHCHSIKRHVHHLPKTFPSHILILIRMNDSSANICHLTPARGVTSGSGESSAVAAGWVCDVIITGCEGGRKAGRLPRFKICKQLVSSSSAK